MRVIWELNPSGEGYQQKIYFDNEGLEEFMAHDEEWMAMIIAWATLGTYVGTA